MFRAFNHCVRTSGLVRWFALFYLLVSVIAGTHEHRHRLALFQGHRTTASVASLPSAITPSAGHALSDSASVQITASERDCPVCSFLANLVSPAIVPQIVCLPLLSEAVPALPLQTKPFVPYRFCARSSSRAPPAFT